jgi:hypothetical protein
LLSVVADDVADVSVAVSLFAAGSLFTAVSLAGAFLPP